MNIPNLNQMEESWDERKERVLNKLSTKGKKFLEEKHKKFEDLQRNSPKKF